jgi:alkanesulfonate monooxygenase SsuD/methylene tetrahydromethanopterin reductase-like flavin-dependent oxidoreductase (luciferase family)
VQRPHPPLLIGAQGKRLLSFAAREADIVGIAPSWSAHPGIAGENRLPAGIATDNQVGWLRDAAGSRFDQLELNMAAFPVAVTDDAAARAADVAARSGLSPEEVLASPHVLIGTVDEICDGIEARRERWGVSYWVVPAAQRRKFAPVVERLSGR